VGAWYQGRMTHLAWVIFWKTLILSVWGTFKEYREKRQSQGVDPRLVALLKHEWDRRSAKQPRLLTDQRTRLGE
jgi:hypothetical protein